MKNKFNPVIVNVKGPNVEDERLFTSPRKLHSYVKMLKKHYPDTKIDYKQYKAN